MKPATLGLIYVFKFSELIFLMIWTVLVWQSCISFTQTVWAEQEKEMRDFILMGLLPLCCVLSLFNLFYNNLLINLRFTCKTECVSIGECVYDIVNMIFCHRCLHTLCRDYCISWPTLTKWGAKIVIFGATILLAKRRVDDWEAEYEIGEIAKHEH